MKARKTKARKHTREGVTLDDLRDVAADLAAARHPLPGSRHALDALDLGLVALMACQSGFSVSSALAAGQIARASNTLRGLIEARRLLDDGSVQS